MLFQPFETSDHLCMAKKFAKVNVKHVPRSAKHDIVIVAVTDAKQIGSHTATRTRIDEVFWGL